jgi:uncharacterized phage infection (PIP) family protein YhgE
MPTDTPPAKTGLGRLWGHVLNASVDLGLAERLPAPGEPADPHTQAPAPASPRAVVAPLPRPLVNSALANELKESARATLIAAMEASGATLVDQLLDLLESLQEDIKDETALYRAAIKVMVKQGHSVHDLRQDFDKCIGALEESDRKFEATLKGQLERRVGTKMKAATDAREQIKALQDQIGQLQSQIAELGAAAHEAESGIAEEQAQLALAQTQFTQTYDTIRAGVESHCAKVTQYGEKL